MAAALKTHRLHVYGELLETEKIYVRDLETLVCVFLDPLRSNGLLTADELEAVFSNVDMLLRFHRLFLADLSSDGISGRILESFERHIAYFNMYSCYCSHYHAAIALIKERASSSSAFATFLESARRDERTRGLDLASFLIKPVQRICKYPLFFRDLQKHSRGKLKDKITDLKDKVECVSTAVNTKMTRMSEGAELVAVYQKLQPGKGFSREAFSALTCNPSRRFLCEYELEAHAAGSHVAGMKHYFLLLFSDILVLARPPTTLHFPGRSEGKLNVKQVFELSKLRVDEPGELELTLHSEDGTTVLHTESAHVAAALYSRINEAVSDAKEAHRNALRRIERARSRTQTAPSRPARAARPATTKAGKTRAAAAAAVDNCKPAAAARPAAAKSGKGRAAMHKTGASRTAVSEGKARAGKVRVRSSTTPPPPSIPVRGTKSSALRRKAGAASRQIPKGKTLLVRALSSGER